MILVQMLDQFRRQKGIIMKRHTSIGKKSRRCDRHDNSTIFLIASTTRLNAEDALPSSRVHLVTAVTSALGGKLAESTVLAVTVMES